MTGQTVGAARSPPRASRSSRERSRGAIPGTVDANLTHAISQPVATGAHLQWTEPQRALGPETRCSLSIDPHITARS
jgi:hypothetical protein